MVFISGTLRQSHEKIKVELVLAVSEQSYVGRSMKIYL